MKRVIELFMDVLQIFATIFFIFVFASIASDVSQIKERILSPIKFQLERNQ